jgi:hypothetical protein
MDIDIYSPLVATWLCLNLFQVFLLLCKRFSSLWVCLAASDHSHRVENQVGSFFFWSHAFLPSFNNIFSIKLFVFFFIIGASIFCYYLFFILAKFPENLTSIFFWLQFSFYPLLSEQFFTSFQLLRQFPSNFFPKVMIYFFWVTIGNDATLVNWKWKEIILLVGDNEGSATTYSTFKIFNLPKIIQ